MNIDNARKRVRSQEGRIYWLYKDIKGIITTAEGHALRKVDDARKLPFTVNGQAAADSQIRADWNAVTKAPSGLRAVVYESMTLCRLSDAAVDAITELDITVKLREIKVKLPKFGEFPDNIQEALFDIGFNSGAGGLMKFKEMLTALDQHNYKVAALESYRPDLAPKDAPKPHIENCTDPSVVGLRNAEIARLIINA